MDDRLWVIEQGIWVIEKDGVDSQIITILGGIGVKKGMGRTDGTPKLAHQAGGVRL